MKIQIDNGGRTLSKEDMDCYVRSFSKVTGLSYGAVWKTAAAKYGRRLGEPIKFRSDERCGRSSDLNEFDSLFRWNSLPQRPTVGALKLGAGKYVLDICCADSWGGHHLAAAINDVVFDNEEESQGLEGGIVVGYWKLDEAGSGLMASAVPNKRVGNLVAYPSHPTPRITIL